MCTIITLDKASFGSQAISQILADARGNDDGYALLMVDANGVFTQLRTFDVTLVLALLSTTDWERMFLHARMATQGTKALANTHGWISKGVAYMHNGILRNVDAASFDVDSQLIGHWIDEGGAQRAVDMLVTEPYANVFLINTDGGAWYSVSRSEQGTLYTDGNGNFSSNPFGAIVQPVDPYTLQNFDLPQADDDDETDYGWNGNWEHDFDRYGSLLDDADRRYLRNLDRDEKTTVTKFKRYAR